MARSLLLSMALLTSIAFAFACDKNSTHPPVSTVTPLQFTGSACGFELPAGQTVDRVRCGTVSVPENRAKPDGPKLALAVAVLKATGAQPASDPLLFLDGGPGAPTLQDTVRAWTADFAAPIQTRRDIVFFDQRGDGLSTPPLSCPAAADARHSSLAFDLSGTSSELFNCRSSLKSAGVDLASYTSASNAADATSIMEALGYATYNLYGVSYGTRLALTMMRDHPGPLRSVVLDSVLPVQVDADVEALANFQRALATIAAACDAEPSCQSAYPDVIGAFDALVVKAGSAPFRTQVNDPRSGRAWDVILNGSSFAHAVFRSLYSTQAAAEFPRTLARLAQNDARTLRALGAGLDFGTDPLSDAVHLSINCNEDVPFYQDDVVTSVNSFVRITMPPAEAIGIASLPALGRAQMFCVRWVKANPDPIEHQAIVSDVPSLLLAGAFDPVTPPSWASLAAQTLSRSSVLTFPATSHGVLHARHDCAASVISAFLDAPSDKPDTACVSAIQPSFEIGDATTP